MFNACDPRFEYCPRVSKDVRVCRSEAECRDEYGCTKPDCPLANEFGLEAFDKRIDFINSFSVVSVDISVQLHMTDHFNYVSYMVEDQQCVREHKDCLGKAEGITIR